MTRTSLAVVIAAAFLAIIPLQTPAAETVYLFLKLNGSPVTGESTQATLGRQDSIECTSYTQKVTVPTDAASGLATGRAQIQPIIITKRIDKASPLLMKGALTNEVAEGEFRFYRPNPRGDGTTEQFYTVRFTNGSIVSVRQYVPAIESAKVAEPPQEEVTFACGHIEYTYPNGGTSTTANATGATSGVGDTSNTTAQGAGGTATVGTAATSPADGDTWETATAATNECVLGTAYRLGTDKDGITLSAKIAEYTPGHVAVGSGFTWAAKDEKLMVVHCTLANSNATTTHVRWNTIEWNATLR
jgi:type VI secretion system secreted protein Hcp